MLNKDIEEKDYIQISRKEYDVLIDENKYIKQQLSELRRMIFGRRSEKLSPISLDQPTLFDPDYNDEVVTETKEVKYNKTIRKSQNKNQLEQ